MAFKTMLRQLISKWGIMSIDLQTAFEQDTIVESSEDYMEAAEIALPSAVDDGGADASEENPQEPEILQEEEQVNINDL